MGNAASIEETNPFHDIADSNPEDARVLACAFAVANDCCDVYAALRMHRKCGGADLFSYLMGCHFADWHVSRSLQDIDPDLLPELRDMAHEFLEGGV